MYHRCIPICTDVLYVLCVLLDALVMSLTHIICLHIVAAFGDSIFVSRQNVS